MDIFLFSPVPERSQKGNNVTVNRWKTILTQLDHNVSIIYELEDQPSFSPDIFVALHARRSASELYNFNKYYPNVPIVLALTGTDVYRDIHENDNARRSLDLADWMTVLQPKAKDELPSPYQKKASVIHQSISSLPMGFEHKEGFEISVIGHLREIKDPFRAAKAVRNLPENSNVKVIHLGHELENGYERKAIEETKNNSRYRWIGGQPRRRTLSILARSKAMVISSRLEGGANVVTESIACSTPVLASRIPGNTGLLGPDYPGYFQAGSTTDLKKLILKSERNETFYQDLKHHIKERYHLVDPATERQEWSYVLEKLTS